LKDGENKEDVMTFLEKNILPNIHYSTKQTYNKIDYENTEEDIIIHLSFHDINDNRNKLRQQIKMKEYMRQNSNDEVSNLWKMYYQLKSQINVPIPDPDTIKQQRDMYIELLSKIPNSKFKKYIEKCIE
jgi:uncharacterized protein YdcH (DUF465 family)